MNITIKYQAHVQDIGWQDWVSDGAMAGTEGKNLRLEAIKIKLENAPTDLRVKYQTYIENKGWQDWVYGDAVSGTEGQGLRVEALQVMLEGTDADKYSIEYQAHVQDIGWQNWVKDGQSAGVIGKAKKIEAIRIRIVPIIMILDPVTIRDYINAHASLQQKQIEALYKINYYSSNRLIQSNIDKPLVFLFEGIDSPTTYPFSLYNIRYGAMVVVVKNGNILGVYTNASTLPDQPKGNKCNYGTDVPTLREGVYKISYTIHGTNPSYPALHVEGRTNNVVRFGTAKTGWYLSRSDGIDIHAGSAPFSTDPNATWAISAGCLLVDDSEYTAFSKAVGIIKADGSSNTTISGCAIVDRSLMDTTRADFIKLYDTVGLGLITSQYV